MQGDGRTCGLTYIYSRFGDKLSLLRSLIVHTLASVLPTKYDGPSTGIFLASKNRTYLELFVPLTLEIWVQTKMIDDTSAIIVQAVAFAAAEILHKEESSISSRAGRIAVVGAALIKKLKNEIVQNLNLKWGIHR